MPTYVYQCHRCCLKFEEKAAFKDAPREKCIDPDCGGRADRVIQATPFFFKKEGFQAEKQVDGSRIYTK